MRMDPIIEFAVEFCLFLCPVMVVIRKHSRKHFVMCRVAFQGKNNKLPYEYEFISCDLLLYNPRRLLPEEPHRTRNQKRNKNNTRIVLRYMFPIRNARYWTLSDIRLDISRDSWYADIYTYFFHLIEESMKCLSWRS